VESAKIKTQPIMVQSGTKGLRFIPLPSEGQNKASTPYPCLSRYIGAPGHIQDHIKNVYMELDKLTKQAVKGCRRNDDRLEFEASRLSYHVLPNEGFHSMLTFDRQPQIFRVAAKTDIASRIPWEMLEEFDSICPGCKGIIQLHTVPTSGRELSYSQVNRNFWTVYKRRCPECNEIIRFNWLVLRYHITHVVSGGIDLPRATGRKFLIINDPNQNLCIESNQCQNHISYLYKEIKKRGYTCRLISGPRATVKEVKKELTDREIVGIYFFGHGFYDKAECEAYLELCDGRLYASEIRQLHPTASFVYLNACHVGQGSNSVIDGRYDNIAEVFAGPEKVVIAPITRVVNTQAALFAKKFFTKAIEGQNLGNALAYARDFSHRRYAHDHLPDICWLVYRYFGDPNEILPVLQQDGKSETTLEGDITSITKTGKGSNLSKQLMNLHALNPVVFFIKTVNNLPKKLISSKHRKWMIEGKSLPGYYHTGPYVGSRLEYYHRDDGAHKPILDLIVDKKESILVLTGESGVGKTSVLNGLVIPALNDTECVFSIIPNTQQDPLQELRRQLLTPGLIWESPDNTLEELNAIDLVFKAREFLSSEDKRLLIIFDQFENLITMTEQARDRIDSMRVFLEKVAQDDHPETLTVVLCVRSDSVSRLEELGVPLIEKHRNWENILPITRKLARQFLKDSGFKLGEKVIEVLLKEATTRDGLICPRMLSILGLLLGRYVEQEKLFRHDAGNLLRGYVRECTQNEDVQRILHEMLSCKGMPKTKPVGLLSDKTGLDVNAVEDRLMFLAEKGIAQCLNPSFTTSERLWEVQSYVSPTIEKEILDKRPTYRSWIKGAAVVVMALLLTVYLGIKVHHSYIYKEAANLLRGKYGLAVRPDIDDPALVISVADPGALQATGGEDFTGIGPHFARLNRISKIDLSNWDGLLHLKGMTHAKGLKELRLAGTGLESLSHMPSLPNLQKLDLKRCYKLSSLANMPNLPGLQELCLEDCDSLRDLFGMPSKGLMNLQRLDMRRCDFLSNLSGMPMLPNLQECDLENCVALSSLSGMPLQPNLLRLNLRGCTGLSSLSGMPTLSNLEDLCLADCTNLLNLSTLPVLDKLRVLDLTGCGQLTNVEKLKDFPSLESIYIDEDCPGIAMLKQEKPKLEVRHNYDE
jgi:hypothetical protein